MRFSGPLAALFGLWLLAGGAVSAEIVSWAGNSRDWNQRLGVTLGRLGCSSTPDACLHAIEGIAAAEGVERWTISVKGPASAVAWYAAEYSGRSLADRQLVGIDIDDFFSVLREWKRQESRSPADLLMEIAKNAKSLNSELRFGITMYEDQLSSPEILSLPEEVRSLIDRVSLYLHYRQNVSRYADYVDRVSRIFPSAAIWAGSYAYDRIDYLPCSEGGAQPCSAEQEQQLFQESIEIQLQLLLSGKIAGIEFYPGFFGREDEWNGWSNPRICAAPRRSACVETTRKMRAVVASLLEERRSSLQRAGVRAGE